MQLKYERVGGSDETTAPPRRGLAARRAEAWRRVLAATMAAACRVAMRRGQNWGRIVQSGVEGELGNSAEVAPGTIVSSQHPSREGCCS